MDRCVYCGEEVEDGLHVFCPACFLDRENKGGETIVTAFVLVVLGVVGIATACWWWFA